MVNSNEEWRPIPNYETRYHVSSLGRIAVLKNGELVGRKLNLATAYLSFSVSNGPGNPQSSLYVHQVVAIVFLGPRPPGSVIRHLDGNRYNNSAENLSYGTPQENSLDCVKHGTHKGSNNGRAKLDERDVLAIKSLISDNVSTLIIARAFGVAPPTIHHIKDGSNWA